MMDLEIIVPSVVAPGATIGVVGEAPGEEEVGQRLPFVGKAGRVLNRELQVGGIPRASISVYNVVKRPPRGGYDSDHFRKDFYRTYIPTETTRKVLKRCVRCGKNEKNHQSPKAKCREFEAEIKVTEKKGRKTTGPTEELTEYRRLLRDELESSKLNVVVAAGREALLTMCGVDGITKYRGSVLESTLVPGLKVVPIVHPSAILRSAQWQEAYITGMILREKVVPESKTSSLLRRGWVTVEPTITNIEEMAETIVTRGHLWTLDIETRSGIACVGIGYYDEEKDEDVALCIPFQTTTGPYWETLELEQRAWSALDRAMENPRLVGQNILFDLDWLLDYGLLPAGVFMDTMLAHHTLYPELPKGLDFLTMRFTDIPYYKDEGKTWGVREPDAQLWSYNIKDIVATLRVARALEWELRAQGKWKEYSHFTNALIPIAFEMQRRGFEVDEGARQRAREVIKEDTEEIHLRLVSTIGHEINTGSPDQVQELLYKEMGLKVKTNRKTKRVTSDEDAVMELVGENPERRELKYLIAERHLNKAMESYVEMRLGE